MAVVVQLVEEEKLEANNENRMNNNGKRNKQRMKRKAMNKFRNFKFKL